MKGVGEPGAGEPHARIDGRGLETERHKRHRASPRPNQPPVRWKPALNAFSITFGDRLPAAETY